jgi:hypothetical protein
LGGIGLGEPESRRSRPRGLSPCRSDVNPARTRPLGPLAGDSEFASPSRLQRTPDSRRPGARLRVCELDSRRPGARLVPTGRPRGSTSSRAAPSPALRSCRGAC